MLTKLCIIGHPSRYGGADTELDHQIHVWQRLGIEVHCCHTGDLDDNLRSMNLEDRGVVYHAPRDWPSLEGLDVISFCNGRFLEALPEIRRHARTATWVNCMTWAFPKEIEAQQQGLIDFHLYQTPHAQQRLSGQLANLGQPFRALRFNPYFHAEQFPFVSPDARKRDKFRFGHISREDADKFGKRLLWIYETMTAPVLKEGLLLGWSDKARQKFGHDPQPWVRALPAGGVSQLEFYRHCDAVIMSTDTLENLPRVGFEAMASGSVLVVDRKGGWTTQVEDGRTGWLCRDDREFVYKASRCAFEASERAEMARAARERLQQQWGMDAAQESWRRVLEVIERGPESFRVERDPLVCQLGEGPGTELVLFYLSLQMPACQACYDLAVKMNAWGIDGCEQRMEEIVDDILPRAREWWAQSTPWTSAAAWWGGAAKLSDAARLVGASTEQRDAVLRDVIRRQVDAALAAG